MIRDAAYVAHQLGKTTNWVKRNASRFPHHKIGKSYSWTDEDIADILAATRVRPEGENDGTTLRPLTGRRRAS